MGDPRLIAHGEHLSMQRLCKVYASLCCRRDHPLAGTPELSPEALRRFGVGAVSMTPALLLSVARGLGFGSLREFPLTLECDDVSMLLRVVASTDLIGIVPEAPFDLGVERLQRLPWARSRAQYADVHALWLTGRTLTPAARRAIELAREVGFSPPHAAARSR
jgi:DNA-binding transcriptional LysR family regulator